jgi:hypothetical protein
MAVRSLARSGVAGGKYINFLAGNEAFDPSSDFLIEEQVLGTAAATVTFSSIPSTYKHLQIRFTARHTSGTTSTTVLARLNGDTGANYAWHRLRGNGSSVSSAGTNGETSLEITQAPGSGTASNIFSAGIIDILDFSSTTKNTTVRTLAGYPGTESYATLNSGLWLNTATVSSVSLISNGTSFAVASRFSLYGSNG